MIKKNKGITLIALIITIIVLLILAAVSINAIFGENGLIEMARESAIATEISNVIFKLEDDIVDINTENILNSNNMTTNEMLTNLKSRKTIGGIDALYFMFYFYKDRTLNTSIKNTKLTGLTLQCNGDIWYENYKRGKVQLSPNTNTIYSQNKKTKITVIDGTVEEVLPNSTYFLHPLESKKDDFACWINQYGELVSIYPDTLIRTISTRPQEYLALYNNQSVFELGEFNLAVTVDDYEVSDTTIGFEARSVHSNYPLYLKSPINKIYKRYGYSGDGFMIAFSENQDDLKTWDTMQNQTCFINRGTDNNYFNYVVGTKPENIDSVKVIDGETTLYVDDYRNLKYFSEGSDYFVEVDKSKFSTFKSKRLYYRAAFFCYDMVTKIENNVMTFERDESNLKIKLAPTIKFVDL